MLKDKTAYINMQKTIFCIVAVIIALSMTMLSGCSDSNEPEGEEEAQGHLYELAVEIDCQKNLMFSRYDVDISIDNKKVGTLDHGTKKVFKTEVAEGRHELIVAKHDSNSVEGSTYFKTEAQSSKLTCNVECKADEIYLKDFEVTVVDVSAEERADIEKQSPEDSQTKTDNKQASDDEKQDHGFFKEESQENKIAIVRNCNSYSIYYLFDLDTNTVHNLSTIDTGIMVGTFTGNMESGIDITWPYDGGYSEKVKEINGGKAGVIVTDGNGSDWEYSLCDVSEIEKVESQPGYQEMK